MQEGGAVPLLDAAKLGFRRHPPPTGFPKDSKLNFEVRVRKVVRGGAALLQQQ